MAHESDFCQGRTRRRRKKKRRGRPRAKATQWRLKRLEHRTGDAGRGEMKHAVREEKLP